MADLDKLDNHLRTQQIQDLINSYEFMQFVYNHNKKAFARYCYRESAHTCGYFENKECTLSSVASNHPCSDKCEHVSVWNGLFTTIKKLFDCDEDKAKKLARCLYDDNYIKQIDCKHYGNGPFGVVFGTPLHEYKQQWNIEKLAGSAQEFSMEVVTRVFISSY